jgi:hypothetical protein
MDIRKAIAVITELCDNVRDDYLSDETAFDAICATVWSVTGAT